MLAIRFFRLSAGQGGDGSAWGGVRGARSPGLGPAQSAPQPWGPSGPPLEAYEVVSKGTLRRVGAGVCCYG